MPISIDLSLCPLCYGSGTVAAFSDNPELAGTLQPCECVSGVEAITADGEVLGIGKLLHGTQKNAQQIENSQSPPT